MVTFWFLPRLKKSVVSYIYSLHIPIYFTDTYSPYSLCRGLGSGKCKLRAGVAKYKLRTGSAKYKLGPGPSNTNYRCEPGPGTGNTNIRDQPPNWYKFCRLFSRFFCARKFLFIWNFRKTNEKQIKKLFHLYVICDFCIYSYIQFTFYWIVLPTLTICKLFVAKIIYKLYWKT